MRPLSRLGFPLLLAAVLGALHWFARNNPQLLEDMKLIPKRVNAILLFLAALPAIFFVVRLVDLLAFDFVASRRRNVHAPMLLREIVSIGLYLILFSTVISKIFAVSVVGFLTGGAVLAAVLGLALQETLGNLFAGMALHLEDSFQPGDVIRTGEFFGTVEAVRWRGTRIRTFNNNIVIVPNSMLARERVEIFPRTNLNARVLQIGIDYHVPPATVLNVLVQAASNVEGVAHEIPAFARVGNFGDSAVIYEVKYHMYDYTMRDRIDADIRKAVWYALRRNGISIPFPIRSLQRYTPAVPHHEPDTREIVHRLGLVDMLSPLSRDAHEALAAAARVHTYSRGETILRHGHEGDSMFIVHEGIVSVRVDDNEVARLQPGEFFGEMALLTGERRAADIVALADVVAVEITKQALEPILHDHPELATAISRRVTERRDTLDARAGMQDDAQQSVLSRIRAWFGL